MQDIFEIFYFLFCLKSQPYIHKYLITTFNKEYITLQWIQTSTFKNKKQNRISQHLDILHWVMGLLHGRAWAGGDGAAGWGRGWMHWTFQVGASADLSRCTASRSSRLTPAILTLSLCLLLSAPVGQRLLWKWHSGSRTNSKGATHTEGALMENVHSLITDFMPSVFVISTATHS